MGRSIERWETKHFPGMGLSNLFKLNLIFRIAVLLVMSNLSFLTGTYFKKGTKGNFRPKPTEKVG